MSKKILMIMTAVTFGTCLLAAPAQQPQQTNGTFTGWLFEEPAKPAAKPATKPEAKPAPTAKPEAKPAPAKPAAESGSGKN